MGRKRTARTGMPLEWKTDFVNVTDTTSVSATNGEFDLDLLPDELASIVGIDSTIDIANLGIIDNSYQGGMYLSLDPDADDDPLALANLEDLEVFFSHYVSMAVNAVTAASVFANHQTSKKQLWLPEPILVGTNFSQVVHAESTVDAATSFVTTVYFKRKKATNVELANILLKRR